MIMGILAAFHWQQLWPNSWMAWLATPLAATAFARDAHFAALAVAGGWFGRVTRIAANALPQAGQLGSQGGELAAELIVLLPENINHLLLSEGQRSDADWCCQLAVNHLDP